MCNGVPLQPNNASLPSRYRCTIFSFRRACLGQGQNRLLSRDWKPNSLRGAGVYMGGITIKGNETVLVEIITVLPLEARFPDQIEGE